MRQGRPAVCAALWWRRSWGFGGWGDVQPEFLTEELLLWALLVIPETTDLVCCHGHTGSISAIWRQTYAGVSRMHLRPTMLNSAQVSAFGPYPAGLYPSECKSEGGRCPRRSPHLRSSLHERAGRSTRSQSFLTGPPWNVPAHICSGIHMETLFNTVLR